MSHLDEANRVYVSGHEGDPDYEAPCMWFALCDHPANGVGDAGPMGQVPVCRRCAEHVGMAEFVAGGVD